MTRHLIILLWTALSVAPVLSGDAQVADTLDLSAETDLGSLRIGQREMLRVVLRNAMPSGRYTFKTTFDQHEIPPLPAVTIGVPKVALTDAPCSAAIAANGVQNARDEADVANKLAVLVEQNMTLCTADERDSISVVRARTFRDYWVGQLGNADMTLTITRHGPSSMGKDSVKAWTRKYTTPNESPWTVTYGFAFNNNQDERYFVKTVDSTTFVISPRRRVRDYDITPSVMFTYRTPLKGPVELGLTGGLGANKDQFATLLGLSLGIGRNLWATAGVVAHPRKVLNTQYKGDGADTVRTNLDEAQLTEQHYSTFGFFSLSFRFENNPFGGNGGEKEDTAGSKDSSGATKPKQP